MASETRTRWTTRIVSSTAIRALPIAVALVFVPIAATAQQGWGAPFVLGPAPHTTPGVPAVAVDHAGNAIVAWRAEVEAGTVVRARRKSAADGVWSAPVDLSTPAAAVPGNPTAAVDDAGNVVIIWRQGAIFARRYSVTTDSWGGPVVITPAPAPAGCTISERTRVAVDPAGRTFVAWAVFCPAPGFLQLTFTVHVARYAPDTGGVIETRLSDPTLGRNVEVDVAADRLGNATVMWPQPGPAYVVQAATFTAASGTWTAAANVLPNPYDANVDGVRVASDALGHMTAIWRVIDARNAGAIRVVRYDASSRAWAHMTDLGAVAWPLGVSQPTLAVDPAGNVTAVWEQSESTMRRARAARYDAATDTWRAPLDLSAPANLQPGASVATDWIGNTIAVWTERWGAGPLGSKVRSARLTSGGDVSVTDLAFGEYNTDAALAVGAGGQVTIAWIREVVTAPTDPTVEAVEWQATPAAPAIARLTPGDGTLTVTVSPPPVRERAFDAVYYDYSTDDGATWTRRVLPSTVSPLRIGGLTNGVAYAVRVRAVNVAGPGAASAAVVGTPLAAPGAPTGLLVAAQTGRRVTLQWRPPLGGVTPTGYVVEGGGEAGEVEASLVVASGLPTLTFDAPPGSYFVRVHAVAGPAWSPPSNEIRIYVDVPLRPSPPRDLLRLVDGSSVSLSWRNTFEQGTPTGVLLRVDGARGSSTIALPVVETFRIDGVPAGTYEVVVIAVNAAGESGWDVRPQLRVPDSCDGASQGPPRVPTDLVAATSGRGYYLSWAPPSAGPAVESYVVQIGGSYTGTIATTSRALSGAAATGAYTISVAARNSCGAGPATAPATVVIP